jgi:hypothetical protein
MKNLLKNLSLLLISISLTIIVLEFFLRLAGHVPFKYFNSNSPHPSIYKVDKKLGWTSKKGIHSSNIDNNNIISYKFLEDGSRYTGFDLKKNLSEKKIILIGGSFTLGEAINDGETLAYHLQKNLNDYEIKNFGIGGYGTYQSYLKLLNIFDTIENIDYVIYPFIDHHEIRNIGDASWLEFISKHARAPVHMPYVKLDKKNNIVEYSPIKYLVLPLSNYSVLITKIQKKIMRMYLFSKNKDMKLITKKLIIKMNELSQKNNSKFIFVNLSSDKLKVSDYEKFSLENDIQFINCQIELDNKHTVQDDVHPNGLANKKYSSCILKAKFMEG